MAQAPLESKQLMPTNIPYEDISSKSYGELASKLPTREGWPQPLVLYKKYWLKPHYAKNAMILQDSFKPRRDDIILVTHPKCGTTWLKALAFAITNRSRYACNDHPLLTRHPHELVPFLEIPGYKDLAYVETLPSPRLLATHMPLSLLPRSLASHGCRLVYLCRDPKDVLVSRWHFENRKCKGSGLDLDTAFSMFCEGFSSYGPIWNHSLEYWKESLENPGNVIFFKYEEMMLEPVKHVRRLAMFLGAPFTEEEESGGVPEEVTTLCSFQKLISGLQVNQEGVIFCRDDVIVENSSFFRKGKVGDWVNHLSDDKAKRLDYIVKEKLKGSGLVF